MSRLGEMGTPVFWAEGHPGVLKRESWQIQVSGLCDSPKTFSWDELMAMPKSVADARLTSVTRFSVRGRWGGIRVSDLLDAVGARADVSYVRFWSYRDIYDTSIPIDIAREDRTLLSYEFDGEALDEDYGGPIRVFCPYLWGYKSAKSVVKVQLMSTYVSGFWEIRGYPDDAIITAGRVRDMNSGRTRPIPGGEVIRFLDE
ncbi:MAG TPA: molybdopterin-binding oxidoreductase [Deltaproteobacteria bacterium]|nr:molybdopterin-binding oxidoreductase [Deltaproteobacteria bacterium]